MIRDWLGRTIGLPGLNERLELLERKIAERDVTIAIQGERAHVAETLAITTTTALERMDRQIRVLTRVTRSGATRFKTLLDAQPVEQIEIVEALEEEIGRLKAAFEVLESRLDTDAEQARRGLAGLFARIEATRAYGNSQNSGEPPTH